MQSSKEITDKAKEYGLLTSLYSEVRTDQKTIQHNLSRTCSVPTPQPLHIEVPLTEEGTEQVRPRYGSGTIRI